MKRLTIPGINDHVDNSVWVYGEDGLPGDVRKAEKATEGGFIRPKRM